MTKETAAEHTFRVPYTGAVGYGQFFQLSIPRAGEAPVSVSAQGDGWIEFTIRKVGRLTEGVFGLEAGDTLFMRGPYGNAFPVESFEGKALAVIAGGTGLAPVRGMLRYFCERPERIERLYLIAGFKDAACVLFADDLARFKETFRAVYTLDRGSAPGFASGMVTAHIPAIPFREFPGFNAVLAGPPAMMSAAARACIEGGAAEENLWLSLERRMSCAVGKCGHCKINGTYVCLEGPVFNYTAAKTLID